MAPIEWLQSHLELHSPDTYDLCYSCVLHIPPASAPTAAPVFPLDDNAAVVDIPANTMHLAVNAEETDLTFSYTYNIDRQALDALLSSNAENFVITTTEDGLTITPALPYMGADCPLLALSGPRAPISSLVFIVVMLWVFAFCYGRRRTGYALVHRERNEECLEEEK